MKQILIMKMANGYIVVPNDGAGENHWIYGVQNCHVFRQLKETHSYARDGIEDFLEEYFKAPEPEVAP